MRHGVFSLSVAAAAFGALLPPARAADLAALPRTIAKEPTYTGKPVYCLLALGAEAKTRVWVVRDGDTVYVDRNGNGDLTEADEKVAGTSETDEADGMKNTVTDFPLGDLPKVGDKTPYSGLSLRRYLFVPASPKIPTTDMSVVSVTLNEVSTQSGAPTFAPKAADAPVLHLDGPLTIRIPPNEKDEPCVFLKGGEGEQEITAQIGTAGLGARTWAALGYELVGDDVHPQAEITYPPAKAGGTPIVVKFALDSRC
jgi:hypothetical protein